MHWQSILNFMAIAAATLPLISASPVEHSTGKRLDVVTDSNPADFAPLTTTKCATLHSGQSANDTSVIWEDCPIVIARHDALEAEYQAVQKRGIVCKKRNGCQPPCYVNNARSVALLGSGSWSTAPCHAGGLRTQNKGSFAWVSTGHSTSVTWSGNIGLAGPVGEYLDASVGFEVTRSKSINQGLGCVNTDNNPHSVWLQERMGWTESGVTDTTTYTGGGCSESGTHTYYSTVHADFPDPYQSGYRDLIAGCTSPDDGQGPWCNLDAPSLNSN